MFSLLFINTAILIFYVIHAQHVSIVILILTTSQTSVVIAASFLYFCCEFADTIVVLCSGIVFLSVLTASFKFYSLNAL